MGFNKPPKIRTAFDWHRLPPNTAIHLSRHLKRLLHSTISLRPGDGKRSDSEGCSVTRRCEAATG